MVFGELLGGMLEGAGEHYRQRELRRHALENWQRENDLQLTSNFLTQNYGNLSPDQIGNLTGRIEKLTGMKTGALGAMIPVAQAIHQFIPPQPSPPDLGEARTGAVTATPSTEAPVTIASPNSTAPVQTKFGAIPPANKFAGQSIAAPANIQISQIPTPAETATPSIFAPQPGYMAQSEPRLQMTPNQILARQQQEEAARRRQQTFAEIEASNLSPELRQAAYAKQFEVNAVPVITSNIGARSREAIQNQKEQEIRANPRFVIRGGEQIPIIQRRGQETFYDPNVGREMPYIFQPGDKVYEKSGALGAGVQLIQDDNGTYAVNKAGALAGVPGSVQPVPGIGGRPQPQTQLTTITGPEGPAVVEYTPQRGGKGGGNVKVVQKNAIKGLVPPLSASTQDEIKGLATAADNLSQLQALLPQIQMGPLWGRVRNVQFQYLGGFGSTPEEQLAASKMSQLLISAFDIAGRNFTGHERKIIDSYYPQNTDTVEVAMTKANEALRFINQQVEIRKGLISPMQRSQTQFPTLPQPKGAGGNTPPPPPNTGAAGQRREQRNKTTGQYRYSLDGGQTWQPGRLPQQ